MCKMTLYKVIEGAKQSGVVEAETTEMVALIVRTEVRCCLWEEKIFCIGPCVCQRKISAVCPIDGGEMMDGYVFEGCG